MQKRRGKTGTEIMYFPVFNQNVISGSFTGYFYVDFYNFYGVLCEFIEFMEFFLCVYTFKGVLFLPSVPWIDLCVILLMGVCQHFQKIQGFMAYVLKI